MQRILASVLAVLALALPAQAVTYTITDATSIFTFSDGEPLLAPSGGPGASGSIEIVETSAGQFDVHILGLGTSTFSGPLSALNPVTLGGAIPASTTNFSLSGTTQGGLGSIRLCQFNSVAAECAFQGTFNVVAPTLTWRIDGMMQLGQTPSLAAFVPTSLTAIAEFQYNGQPTSHETTLTVTWAPENVTTFVPPAEVPLPAGMVLLVAGLGGLMALRRQS